MSNQPLDHETTIASLRKSLRIYKLICALYTLALLSGIGYYGGHLLAAPTYMVRVNGKLIAAVSEQSVAQTVLSQIKEDKAGAHGDDAEFVQRVEVRPSFFTRVKPVDGTALKSLLENKLSLKVPAWVIMANGEPAVALPSEQEAQATLDGFKKKMTEGRNLTQEPTIKEKITIERVVIDPEGVCANVEEGIDALALGDEDSNHTVANGETAWTIAKKYDLTPEELASMNPGRNMDRLAIGDTLKVTQEKPRLTVVTEERRTITEPIPYKSRDIERSDIKQGKVFIKQAGRTGKRQIQVMISCENGSEVHREVESSRTITWPQDEIRTVGIMGRRGN